MMNTKKLYDQIRSQVARDKEDYLYWASLPEQVLGYLQSEVRPGHLAQGTKIGRH